jgi:hypothetical protein
MPASGVELAGKGWIGRVAAMICTARGWKSREGRSASFEVAPTLSQESDALVHTNPKRKRGLQILSSVAVRAWCAMCQS